jgi:hypothetical protein
MPEDIVLSPEDEQIVQEGEAAGTLLSDPVFLIAIERIRAQCAEGILQSAPDQAPERERLYNLSRGLSAVTEELLTMQALGETTLDNATRPTEADEVQDNPDLAGDH